ncbi:MAG: pentapeptide repeat-containing protein [Mariniphaga sp.]|nr:pentapeptide repeat-containing protein [Mariniphaga sp.]
MSKKYITDKNFQGDNFSENVAGEVEYENCTFDLCNFSNSDLSDTIFAECIFKNSDLSMAKIIGTAFRDVRFESCKLIGLHFDDCNKFLLSMDFGDCMLNLSSFYQLALKNSKFKNCTLQEVDFTETDLSGLSLDNCNLSGALFENTNLEKCDLRTSRNYSIDPENNRIKKAKFSIPEVTGLLDKYDIEIE